MAMPKRFEVLAAEAIEEAKPPVTTAPPQNQISDASPKGYEQLISLLILALRTLGERSINFVGHLIPVIGLAMGFFLWNRVLPEPTVYQLIGLGLYGFFVLAMIAIKR